MHVKNEGWWAEQRSRGGIDVLPGRQRPTYLVFLFQMGRASGLGVSSVALGCVGEPVVSQRLISTRNA